MYLFAGPGRLNKCHFNIVLVLDSQQFVHLAVNFLTIKNYASCHISNCIRQNIKKTDSFKKKLKHVVYIYNKHVGYIENTTPRRNKSSSLDSAIVKTQTLLSSWASKLMQRIITGKLSIVIIKEYDS